MDSAFNFPVVLFDGVCNLCHASVQWVLRRDQAGQFRFAALQSDTGRQLLTRFGLDAAAFDSVVMIDGERIFTHSDAVLELLRRLGGPWAWLHVLRVLPRPLRNAVYDWVARHRYRWFGRQQECWLPRPEWRDRFL